MSVSRRIEDYVVVTLITLLIWFYAESRGIVLYNAASPERPLTLTLRPANKELVITSQSIKALLALEFSGSQHAISRFRGSLAGGLTLDIDLPGPGRHVVSLPRRISERFQDANVSLTRVEPDTVEVTVTKIVERDAELVFKPEDVRLQEGELKIDPPTVRVTLTEEKLAELAPDGKLSLPLKAARDLRALQAGVKTTVPARVELPPALAGDPNVKVVPPEVSVSLIVDKKEATEVLSAVPVFVSAPPAELGNFTIRIHEEDRLLKDVKVTGPADLVQKVKSGAIGLEARVRLTRDDLVEAAKKGESTYQVKFVDLPPGLVVDSPKTAVRATITRAMP